MKCTASELGLLTTAGFALREAVANLRNKCLNYHANVIPEIIYATLTCQNTAILLILVNSNCNVFVNGRNVGYTPVIRDKTAKSLKVCKQRQRLSCRELTMT